MTSSLSSVPRFCKPKGNNIDIPTRFLYVSGVGDLLDTNPSVLKEVFSEYGVLGAPFIEMVPGKSFCFIVYENMESAILAKTSIQDKIVEQLGNIKLFVKYAQESTPPQPNPEPEECVGSDVVLDSNPCNTVHVPGLYVIEDFITEEVENNLLEGLCALDRPWETLLNRNVQHFGFEFNYRTLLLDYTKDTPPLPTDPCLQTILTQIQLAADNIVKQQQQVLFENGIGDGSVSHNNDTNHMISSQSVSTTTATSTETARLVTIKSPSTVSSLGTYPLNQLTMNEYKPGQGIAHHVDSPTCFGPVICILSIAADISMTFAAKKEGSFCRGSSSSSSGSSGGVVNSSSNNNSNHVDGIEDSIAESTTTSAASASITNINPISTANSHTVHMYVRRRSLMIFTQASRYTYTHGIASRRTDKFQGVTMERQRRVSLTFRQAIVPGAVPSSHLAPSQLEKTHVHEIYDAIATHWHHTRGKRKVHWHSVKAFLLSLPKGSLVADVGCGDGKYFNVNPDITVIGCDRSDTLLQVSKDCYTTTSSSSGSSGSSISTTTSKPSSSSSSSSSDVVVNTNSVADTFCCDAVMIPLLSDTFDATLCIAVLHHISTLDRRLAVIRELLRITKPGGEVLLQAWALEQDLDTQNIDMASSSNNNNNSISSSTTSSNSNNNSTTTSNSGISNSSSSESASSDSTSGSLSTLLEASSLQEADAAATTNKKSMNNNTSDNKSISSQQQPQRQQLTPPRPPLSIQQQKHQLQQQQQQRRFDFQSASGDQDLFVPWSLPQRFASTTTALVAKSDSSNMDASSTSGTAIAAVEEEEGGGGDSSNGVKLDKILMHHNTKNGKEYQRVCRQPAIPKVYEFLDTDTPEERAAKERRQIEEKRKARGIEKREKATSKRLKLLATAAATAATSATGVDDDVSNASSSSATAISSSSDNQLPPQQQQQHITVDDSVNGEESQISNSTDATATSHNAAMSKTKQTNGSRSLHSKTPSSSSSSSSSNQVLHRYCHVYKQGELEDLCSSVPNCRLVASGYDKGNWFVRLQRVNDARLLNAYVAPPAPAPVITHRGVLHRRQYPHHEKKSNSVKNSNASTTNTDNTNSSNNSGSNSNNVSGSNNTNDSHNNNNSSGGNCDESNSILDTSTTSAADKTNDDDDDDGTVTNAANQ